MPWLYTLTLTAKTDAGTIQSDWEAAHPATTDLGVSQAGFDAVITSTSRDPNFADFATEVGYVDSITEHMEIPAPTDAAWNPPYEAHPNGTIEFVE